MSADTAQREITEADRLAGFIRATSNMAGAKRRWNERARTGLTDANLAQALAFEIGIMGGSCGPDSIWLSYQAAGLQIWISWESHSTSATKPVFAGNATIAMARRVYAIKDPADIQLALF